MKKGFREVSNYKPEKSGLFGAQFPNWLKCVRIRSILLELYG